MKRKLLKLRHHPLVVPVVTFLVLFFVATALFIVMGGQTVGASDSHIVDLSIDGQKQIVPTRATTVADLLQRLKIPINEGDVVEPASDTQILEDNFKVNIYRAKPVTIIDGTHKTFTLSAATSPRTVAQEAGVTVYPEDNLNKVPTTNFVQEGSLGTQIIIDRATPVNLNLYGTAVVVRTHAKTVADLLKEKNIKVASDDVVTPSASSPISSSAQVFVTRHGTQLVTVSEAIPAPTQTVTDNSLTFGTTAIRQQGQPGQKLVTYQIDLENGQEVGRHEIQEVVAQEPVPEIIAVGQSVFIRGDEQALMAAAGISPSDYPYVDYIVGHESGWCSTKWQGEVGYCPAFYEQIHPTDGYFGYGLCQSTPPDKMAADGGDWATNPVTQLRWCTGYADRYGGWGGSYEHWLNYRSW